MLSRLVAAVILASFALSSRVLFAQPVLITAPQTIGPVDTTIVPTAGGPAVPLSTAQITVEGSTLTINGRHAIASLQVVRNAGNVPGVVTHSAAFTYDYSGGAGTDVVKGLWLVVSGNVNVEGASGSLVGSSIDVTGCGYPMANGPGAGGSDDHYYTIGGGGGYGGNGANGSGDTVSGGRPYGSYSQPSDLGSGSGRGNYPGAAGGGAVRLIVNGMLTVNGALRSNGAYGAEGYSSAGSGGSLWITATTVAGSGVIEADGVCSPAGYSAGGGGRIAIYAGSVPFAGVERAIGGSGSQSRGGAGTLYHVIGGGTPQLIYDNGGGSLGNTEPVGDVLTCAGDVIVRGHAVLAHAPANTQGLSINVTGTLTVDADGSIDVTGCGYPMANGPGAGDSSALICTVAGGGAYGGRGAHGGDLCFGHEDPHGGWSYGSYTQPSDLGSGSGRANYPGGPGGGAMRLTVSGELTLNGVLRSNGTGAAGTYFAAGSGGSIWVSAGSLTGAGLIQADGVGAADGLGAGGGGRIAIYTCEQQLPTDHITAAGVRGLLAASESGTIYITPSSASITSQPVSHSTCPSSATFDVAVTSAGGVLYHWQVIDSSSPLGWSDLPNGSFIRDGLDFGTFSGTDSPHLTWDGIYSSGNPRGYFLGTSGQIRCEVIHACGSIASQIVTLSVCAADFNCDSLVDFFDYLDFVDAFSTSVSTADFNGDGIIDFFDYLDFVDGFSVGC